MLRARHGKLATTCRRTNSRPLASSTRERADASANGETRQNQRKDGRRAPKEWKRPHAAGGMGRVGSPQEAGCQGLPCAPAAARAQSTYVRHCGANCTARPLLLNPAQRRSFAKRATPAGKPGQQRQQRSGRLLAPVSPHTACRAPRLDRRRKTAKSLLFPPLLARLPRLFSRPRRGGRGGSNWPARRSDGIGPAFG